MGMPFWVSSRDAAVLASVPTTTPSFLQSSSELEAVVVAAADQLQRVDVIGPRKAESLLAVGRVFHAVHGEIEIAAEQPGSKLGKLVVLELDRPADFALQGVAEIDLETDVLARMVGVHGNVGAPPSASPAQSSGFSAGGGSAAEARFPQRSVSRTSLPALRTQKPCSIDGFLQTDRNDLCCSLGRRCLLWIWRMVSVARQAICEFFAAGGQSSTVARSPFAPRKTTFVAGTALSTALG